ncbi:uncharacterized protein LOC108410913 [Pygocentrus nattereri]|uniref:Septin-type G domain-containing protein n=1 Tax=Pygocentrus nattereri TaxID=42514 RepID=A0A3B4EKN6_PYGNA|nr:uncharacterized protein LOC108410913 [Pygocentrus nattereri]
MANRLSDASSSLNDLIMKGQMLNPGPPARYRLYTTRSDLEKDGKIRKWTFGQKYDNPQNKTVLMVGETGTGKTTLINTMVNYFLGVKFEDKVWFEITDEEKRAQTESQTSEITVYEINSDEKHSSLTIVDTPGYGDTRGRDKDTEIARNLHQLLIHGTGVKELDAVCLVLKASQNRISDRLRYIFEGVLSLFGKDIEDIIVLFITHSDGGPPTNVLQAIEKEKIPCCHDDENEPVHFLFNNRQSEKRTKRYEYVYKSSWEMGESSLKEFFEFLKSRQAKSLTMTVSVLRERLQLEACVESLKERITFTEAKQKELAEAQKSLKLNKEKIENGEDFTMTVTIAYKEKVDITNASWWDQKATSCRECKENCHEYNCWAAINAAWCHVMEGRNCTVCNCPDSKHVREARKYVIKQRKEVVTFDQLLKKYTNKDNATYDEECFRKMETKHGKLLKTNKKMADLDTSLKRLRAENEEQKKSLVKDAYMAIVKLSEIALKPNSAFTIQHLDFLIPRVEEAGTAEWVQKLKNMQREARESTKSAVGYFRRVVGFFSGK